MLTGYKKTTPKQINNSQPNDELQVATLSVKNSHSCLWHGVCYIILRLLQKICTVLVVLVSCSVSVVEGYDYAGCYIPDYTYGNAITASDMTLDKCAEICQQYFGG